MTIRLLRQIWQNKDSNQNNHSWISGTRFEQFHNIVLYDFAIHWFDTVRYVFGEREAKQVFSQVEHLRGQELKPPLSAQNIIQFDGGLASLVFHAHTMFSPAESITVTGTKGTFRSSGPVCRNEDITLTIEEDRGAVQFRQSQPKEPRALLRRRRQRR